MNKTKTTISKKGNSNKTKSDIDQNQQTKTTLNFSETMKNYLQTSLTTKYIKLISTDESEFIIPVKVAECSGKIKALLKEYELEHMMKEVNIVTDREKNRSTNNLVNVKDKEIEKMFMSTINSKFDNGNAILSIRINYRSEVVEILVDYLNYKYYYENINIPDNMKNTPSFDFGSEFGIELLNASNEYIC